MFCAREEAVRADKTRRARHADGQLRCHCGAADGVRHAAAGWAKATAAGAVIRRTDGRRRTTDEEEQRGEQHSVLCRPSSVVRNSSLRLVEAKFPPPLHHRIDILL